MPFINLVRPLARLLNLVHVPFNLYIRYFRIGDTFVTKFSTCTVPSGTSKYGRARTLKFIYFKVYQLCTTRVPIISMEYAGQI